MSIGRPATIAMILGMLSLFGSSAATARVWKATPPTLAQDYAVILDTRSGNEFVELVWLVPEMIRADTAGAAEAKDILRQYVVIMFVHARLDRKTVTYTFDDIGTPEVTDATGKPLVMVPHEEMTPKSAGVVALLEAGFRQSFGAMGKGTKVLIFNPGDVSSCRSGRLSVRFADENYTWETPFPGCPSP
jgi:hypothetical protein